MLFINDESFSFSPSFQGKHIYLKENIPKYWGNKIPFREGIFGLRITCSIRLFHLNQRYRVRTLNMNKILLEAPSLMKSARFEFNQNSNTNFEDQLKNKKNMFHHSKTQITQTWCDTLTFTYQFNFWLLGV